jgi:ABC-type cobalamin/Fe3+-siderophores transport system ATPase subunit
VLKQRNEIIHNSVVRHTQADSKKKKWKLKMKIKTVRIENFRAYKSETTFELNDLNVIVGKNDIGKSTVLEALDIFFNENKGIIKIDKDDVNKKCKKD